MATDIFARPFTVAAPGFTGATHDRADEVRRDARRHFAARVHPAARWLLFDELKPLCADGDPFELQWLRHSELPENCPEVFLGFDGDTPCFAAAGSCAGLQGTAVEARSLAARLDGPRAALVAQARSLLDWHARHGFCASCGAPTAPAKAGYARTCGGCGREHFPRTDPVVIMLALDGDKALLGRGPRFPKGSLSALAGFVEPGESLEEAVRRELYEEAGIRASRVAYVASQPWPFPSSLMIGAFAEAETVSDLLLRYPFDIR